MEKVIAAQKKVLHVLSGKTGSFALAGGTALSLFYFRHRESYDLDFFSNLYSKKEVEEIVTFLSLQLKVNISLDSEISAKNQVKMRVYYIPVLAEESLRIDFVEDVFKRINHPTIMDGIPVLSKEDIYFRKIMAACGSGLLEDASGKMRTIGGRREAKDFFDLYFLSGTFMNLSIFVNQYCGASETERVIYWFRSYDRFEIKAGLSEIITDKKIDFHKMERHFKEEIERLIQMQFGKER